jgi:hypothetical protein
MNSDLLLENPDRVIAKAWADDDFRTALMANPREALKAQGIEIPEGVTLNVLEDSETVINLVLPRIPDMVLAGEELGQSAEALRCGGGGCRCGGCGCGGCGCGGGGCLCLCL